MEKEKIKKVKKSSNIIKLEEELALEKEKGLRIQAEMINMRKRQEEEITKLRKYDGEDFLEKLLPTIDNFERALLTDDEEESEEVKNYKNGFKMIYANLLNFLNSIEVKEIDCLGKPFDPELMEAITMDQDKDHDPNEVLDVFQKGYTYKDKLLRPAMVKVNESENNK